MVITISKISVKSAKAKARRLQDYVRDRITEVYNLSSDDIRCAIMGESGADIKLSKHAQGVVPLAIECKARAKVAIYSDYDQAKYHARETDLIPIVVIKADRKEPLVILNFDKFLEIINNAKDL